MVLAYAAASFALAGAVTAFRLALWSPPADIPPAWLDLLAAFGWPHLALWSAAAALYAVVGLKLLRRVKAFVWWGAAFTLDVINRLWSTSAGAYEGAIPIEAVYGVLAGSLVAGALIWALGRTHLD